MIAGVGVRRAGDLGDLETLGVDILGGEDLFRAQRKIDSGGAALEEAQATAVEGALALGVGGAEFDTAESMVAVPIGRPIELRVV